MGNRCGAAAFTALLLLGSIALAQPHPNAPSALQDMSSRVRSATTKLAVAIMVHTPLGQTALLKALRNAPVAMQDMSSKARSVNRFICCCSCPCGCCFSDGTYAVGSDCPAQGSAK